HIVLVGVLPIAPGVGPQDLRGAGPRWGIASERGERRQVGRALGQPQMLQTRPVAVVPLAALDLAAARTAVRVGAPRIEQQRRAVLGADAAVGRQQRLRGGQRRHAGEQRGGALAEMGDQRREIGRARDLRPARRELLRAHHTRTPSRAQRTGSSVAPAARAAAITGAGLSPVTKNMQPPAPEPAALPPSAPAAVTACSSRAISGVRISGSSVCWCFQFSVSSAATRVRLAERTASAMRSATSFMARSASVTSRSPRPYAAITRAMVAP